MHLVLDKNRELVMRIAEECGVPFRLAVRIVQDWEEGRNLELQRALDEQKVVAAQNAREKHRGVDGVGQCQQRIGGRLEHVLTQIYGREAVEDKGFMKKLDRENALGLKPHYETKARIVVDREIHHEIPREVGTRLGVGG